MTAVSLIFGLTVAFQAGSTKLAVVGDVVRPTSLTNTELGRRFADDMKEVTFELKGEPGKAKAIPLARILEVSAPKVDPKKKNAVLALAIVAQASDGYTACFSGAEVSDGREGRRIWVALDWNGKPFEATDGPVRLIVMGDEKPSRWVHGVRTLRVVNLADSSDRL